MIDSENGQTQSAKVNPTQKQFSMNRTASKKQSPINQNVKAMQRIFLLFVCLTISVVSFGQDKAASRDAAPEIPPGPSMKETAAWIKRELKAMGSDHITTHITKPYNEATWDDNYSIESAVLSGCVLTIRQVIQHDGAPNHQTEISTITMKDVGRVDVRQTTVAPGITMSKPIYFVILTAIPDRGDPFLLECDGGPGGKTNWAFHVIRVQIRDQNEANQVADVFRRAAVLCGAPSQPVGTAVTEPAQEQLTAEEIQNIVTKSTAGQFASPLAEKTLSEFLVAESNKTGVPTWLVLAQAKRETSFGSPQNGTVQDGRTFEDGTKGNAHNLFNIRPGSSWTGKKLDLGPGSGEFRVYDSYQDSVRDYMRLMSSSLYKGLTLHGLVYKYFPPSDNGGSAATERYIDTIINFAASQGVTITRDTVVVPAAPSDEKNACINNLRQIDAAKHQWALEGKGTASDTPTEREIASYLKEGIPKCPAGGVYTFLNAVDSVPTCSVAGHALPQ